MSDPEAANIPEETAQVLKKFKFKQSKTVDILTLSIDKATQAIVVDNQFEDVVLDDFSDELPSHEPRYIFINYQYNTPDGRKVYPFVLVFYTPEGSPPNLKMLYSASLSRVTQNSGIGKAYELRDLDDFNDAWLKEMIGCGH